jgi:hypothetical protein
MERKPLMNWSLRRTRMVELSANEADWALDEVFETEGTAYTEKEEPVETLINDIKPSKGSITTTSKTVLTQTSLPSYSAPTTTRHQDLWLQGKIEEYFRVCERLL